MKGLLTRSLFQRFGWAGDVLPAVIYLCVLLYAGMIPMQSLPAPSFVAADKFWHLIAFGGLAAMCFRAIHHFKVSVRRASVWAAVAASGLGALLELMQAFSPYRSAELADFAADALGALIAFGIIRLLAKGEAGQPPPGHLSST